MNFIFLLLAGGAGVQGPFFAQSSIAEYQNSHLILINHELIDTRSVQVSELVGSHFVVKFDHPPSIRDRAALEHAGLSVEGYLPHYAYLLTGDPTRIIPLLDDYIVSWAGNFEPDWKIAPALIDGSADPDTLHVWLFDDADVYALQDIISTDFGRDIYSSHDGLNKTLMIPAGDADYLIEIAGLDGIRWIEPFYAPVFHNDRAQWVLQTWNSGNRALWDRGLDGSGVVGCTGDAGLTTSHVMFADSSVDIFDWGDYPDHRKVIAYQPSAPGAVFGDMAAVNYHGTHTAGTVCGDDSYRGLSSIYDGMAPESKLYFIDIGTSSGVAYPADYNDMYLLPWEGNTGGRARFMSNSWGSGGAYRSYDIPCRQTDEFVWNHPDFLILYSTGNSGGAGVSPPSTAKNVVSVGATGNGTSATSPAGFSSMGPTSDGRLKPAVTGPGQDIMSAHGGSTDGYHSLSGTSMSCPAIAGTAALVIQYFEQGWYPNGSLNSADSMVPSAALLRALLINSTIADFINPIPDPQVGWGRVCADSVLYFAGEDNRLYVHDNPFGLQTGDDAVYRVDVNGNDWPLRVSLCWSDYPAEPAAAQKIVNNLDLEAISPSGDVYFGNVFTGNYSKKGGSRDEINVEECLRIADPEPGMWEIHVKASNVPMGPQPYGLVMTGMFGVNEADLASSGIRIDDSATPESNDALDPGETALLFPRLRNISDVTAENVVLKLSSENDLITIDTEQSVYGDIEPGVVLEGEGFDVELDETALPDDEISLTAIAVMSGGALLDTLDLSLIVSKIAVNELNPASAPVFSCPTFVGSRQRISLVLYSRELVQIEIFDVSGRNVGIALDTELQAGYHDMEIRFPPARGVYFISVTAGKWQKRVKVIKLG